MINSSADYGSEVAVYKLSGGAKTLKITRNLLPFIIAAAIAVVVYIFNDKILEIVKGEEVIVKYMFWIPFAIAGFGLFLTLISFVGKSYTIWLYERGIEAKKGSKEYSCSYDNLGGITDYTVVHRYNYIPVGKERNVFVYFPGASPTKFTKHDTVNFKDFADRVVNDYSNHIIRGLTPENIKTKEMDFGNNFKLSNGSFVQTGFGKGKDGRVVPMTNITGHKFDKSNGILSLQGYNEKGKEKSIYNLGMYALRNSEVLTYIVDNIIPHVK